MYLKYRQGQAARYYSSIQYYVGANFTFVHVFEDWQNPNKNKNKNKTKKNKKTKNEPKPLKQSWHLNFWVRILL